MPTSMLHRKSRQRNLLVIVLRGWPRVDGPNSWESRLNVGARIMTTTALGVRFTLATFHEVGMRRLVDSPVWFTTPHQGGD